MGCLSYVSMVKINVVDAPWMPPGDPTTYPYGQKCETGSSLPVGYEMEGWLVSPPVVPSLGDTALRQKWCRRPGFFLLHAGHAGARRYSPHLQLDLPTR